MNIKAIGALGLLAASATFLGGVGVAGEAVTYFSKPPTPEELAEALKPSSATRKVKVRGIEYFPADEEPPSQGVDPVNITDQGQSVEGRAVAIPVNFDRGSSQIADTSMPFVDAIGVTLQRDPSLRLTVEGHTDSTGDARRNLMLSWERAFTVFRVLVQKYQIDPERLRPEGKGMNEPIEGTSPDDAVNRRVQLRPIG